MLDFVFFIYALLAAFVLSSVTRNRRLQQPDAPILTFVGWGLMAGSTTLALLLLGFAAWKLIQG